jgi:hypothetical protein
MFRAHSITGGAATCPVSPAEQEECVALECATAAISCWKFDSSNMLSPLLAGRHDPQAELWTQSIKMSTII